MKLTGKIVIKGQILAVTGLHIGGNKNTKRIGELDNPVIKDASGKPYIPGSSIKGKLRSMLAKTEGSVCITEKEFKELKISNPKLTCDEKIQYLLDIFGSSGDNDKGNPSRLIVRDAVLIDNSLAKAEYLDSDYTQYKWENTVNRVTGTAKDPRQQERVPAGAKFRFELILDCYESDKTLDYIKKVLHAMELLEKDYIGGSGSRGYGQIKFIRDKLVFNYYKISSEKIEAEENEEFMDVFNAFCPKIEKNGNS